MKLAQKLFDPRSRLANIGVFALAGLAALAVVLTSDFADPRFFHNGYVRLAGVGALVALLFAGMVFLKGKVRGGLQLGIVLSLDAHLLLLGWLSTHPMLFDGLASQVMDEIWPPAESASPWLADDVAPAAQVFETPMATPVPAASGALPMALRREEPLPRETVAETTRPARLAAPEPAAEPAAELPRTVVPEAQRPALPANEVAMVASGLPRWQRQTSRWLPLPLEPPSVPEAPREDATSPPAAPGPGEIAIRPNHDARFQPTGPRDERQTVQDDAAMLPRRDPPAVGPLQSAAASRPLPGGRPTTSKLTGGARGPAATGVAGLFARPLPGSFSGQSEHRRGLPSGLEIAHATVSPRAMFNLREGEKKKTAIVEHGGNEQTAAAVRLGLEWLKTQQYDDGRWRLNQFRPIQGRHVSGRGSVDDDAAATGLALMPFLGDGHTHAAGEYRHTVRKGLQWLVARQRNDGDLSAKTSGNSHMYAHAIAAIALCEAYGMSKDPALRAPAQKAVDFILAAQTPSYGGWRYQPRQDADTSVVGWQVMALKSAQMASLDVPGDRLDLVHKWLDKAEGKGSEQGRFRYQIGRETTESMTAEALLCLQYLGADPNAPRLQAGARYLAANLPKTSGQTSYYWYYGTQVMYHMQGEFWSKWNEALRDLLVVSQREDGDLAGTWDPKDQWESAGGRIYATSLRLLMLEVYYRHLPLYQALRPEGT